MILKDKKILIISPELWGINYVSKHHYALELSKTNFVFFLNPPSKSKGITYFNKKLKIVDYKPILRGINRMPSLIRNFFNSIEIKRIIKYCHINEFDIIWSFDPFRFQNLNLFNNQLLIYHPVDVHYTPREKEITRSANCIFTTSEIVKKRLLIYNSRIYNIGHGLSDHFISKGSGNNKKNGHIKVSMMGNFQRKIDYTILFSLIESYPQIEFHFIGPYEKSNLSSSVNQNKEILRLISYSNTIMHGSVAPSDLPNILNLMDVFLILYRVDENPASLANPHKVLEYLATGKIILSTFLSEYSDKNHLLTMADKKEILNMFCNIIQNLDTHNSIEKSNDRITYALENTYKKKIMEIERFINENLDS